MRHFRVPRYRWFDPVCWLFMPPSAPEPHCGLRPLFQFWRSTLDDQRLRALAVGSVLAIAIIACLIGFEIGSRHFPLAPEIGGVVMGVGVLAMHAVALAGWNIEGSLNLKTSQARADRRAWASAERESPSTGPSPGDALVPSWRRDLVAVMNLRRCITRWWLRPTVVPDLSVTLPGRCACAFPGRRRRRRGSAVMGNGFRPMSSTSACERNRLPHSSIVVQPHHDRLPNRNRLQ